MAAPISTQHYTVNNITYQFTIENGVPTTLPTPVNYQPSQLIAMQNNTYVERTSSRVLDVPPAPRIQRTSSRLPFIEDELVPLQRTVTGLHSGLYQERINEVIEPELTRTEENLYNALTGRYEFPESYYPNIRRTEENTNTEHIEFQDPVLNLLSRIGLTSGLSVSIPDDDNSWSYSDIVVLSPIPESDEEDITLTRT